MSLDVQFVRNRQSLHATYTVPAPSTSADGTLNNRRPPPTAWCLIPPTSVVARQFLPPSIERNDRIWALFVVMYGTMTVPLPLTTGWPPNPCAESAVARAAPPVSPPSAE